jgi:hypothetical protein
MFLKGELIKGALVFKILVIIPPQTWDYLALRDLIMFSVSLVVAFLKFTLEKAL